MLNKQIDELVQKEVTRKEFLSTVGFGLLSVMGLGTITKLLTGKSGSISGSRRQVAKGYGSMPYGGVKDA